MSNCVHIFREKAVRLDSDEVDKMGLWSLIHNAHEPKPNDKDLANYVAWWFLQTNTTIHKKHIIIRFGEGRSIHTWRDLKQTVAVINTFMKKWKVHTFHMTDEYDGHATWFKCRFTFRPQTLEDWIEEKRVEDQRLQKEFEEKYKGIKVEVIK